MSNTTKPEEIKIIATEEVKEEAKTEAKEVVKEEKKATKKGTAKTTKKATKKTKAKEYTIDELVKASTGLISYTVPFDNRDVEIRRKLKMTEILAMLDAVKRFLADNTDEYLYLKLDYYTAALSLERFTDYPMPMTKAKVDGEEEPVDVVDWDEAYYIIKETDLGYLIKHTPSYEIFIKEVNAIVEYHRQAERPVEQLADKLSSLLDSIKATVNQYIEVEGFDGIASIITDTLANELKKEGKSLEIVDENDNANIKNVGIFSRLLKR